jgi:hypothetical protein
MVIFAALVRVFALRNLQFRSRIGGFLIRNIVHYKCTNKSLRLQIANSKGFTQFIIPFNPKNPPQSPFRD